jgi:hypothetical protein
LDLHGIHAVVIVCECVEGHSDLLEMTDALGLAGAELAFGNDGQEQSGKNRDDRDHHQQLNEREPTPAPTMPESIHGVRLVSTNQHFGCRDDL